MEPDQPLQIIADRRPGKNGVPKALAGVGTGVAFLGIDLIFYIRNRMRSGNAWWETMILVISCIYLTIMLLGLMFARSSAKANVKLADKPLIAFDKEQGCFVVYDLIEVKEMRIPKEDYVSFRVLDDGDARLKYHKREKNKDDEISIGYCDIGQADAITFRLEELRK